jgi:hypothetical protein
MFLRAVPVRNSRASENWLIVLELATALGMYWSRATCSIDIRRIDPVQTRWREVVSSRIALLFVIRPVVARLVINDVGLNGMMI